MLFEPQGGRKSSKRRLKSIQTRVREKPRQKHRTSTPKIAKADRCQGFRGEKVTKRGPKGWQKGALGGHVGCFLGKLCFSKTYVLLKQKHAFWVPRGAKSSQKAPTRNKKNKKKRNQNQPRKNLSSILITDTQIDVETTSDVLGAAETLWKLHNGLESFSSVNDSGCQPEHEHSWPECPQESI